MARQARKKAASPSKIVAYDFETSRIKKGTPRPLYLTAYGESPDFHFDGPIDSMQHLGRLLRDRFLLDDLTGARFVAWNANNFDAYFIAAALLQTDEFIMRPYLTRGNSLRGLRVSPREDQHLDPQAQRSWEFLDGMSMLGLAGVSLEKFLKTFAPDQAKMTGVINWATDEFDPANATHRAYALQDSVGLYHGIARAQAILLDVFNQPLTVTLGNACIKIFKAHIPIGITVQNLPPALLTLTRDIVMRGGYCYCVKRYQGPIWKYDLNQAYAAAMRETKLPCGFAMHTSRGLHSYAKTYIARITATNDKNTIPFYYRTDSNGRLRSLFATTTIADTWLTCIEIDQLRSEGWSINIIESWCWQDDFSMSDYVNKLETVRTTCEGGPSGPIGTMVKAVGNHSYGKTVEQLEPVEYLLASECPDNFAPYYADGFEPIENVWYRFTEPRIKDYHQPHIGAFITAAVRMKVRRAALLSPASWLYADTDCVVFSSDVTAQLDIDPKRYGAWKIEESGTEFRIIGKKIYQNIETGQGHAKGMNVRRLTNGDFEAWFDGTPPIQDQVQRNNFVKVMSGAEMFREQTRTGTAIQ